MYVHVCVYTVCVHTCMCVWSPKQHILRPYPRSTESEHLGVGPNCLVSQAPHVILIIPRFEQS